jgi:hypothetical protein
MCGGAAGLANFAEKVTCLSRSRYLTFAKHNRTRSPDCSKAELSSWFLPSKLSAFSRRDAHTAQKNPDNFIGFKRFVELIPDFWKNLFVLFCAVAAFSTGGLGTARGKESESKNNRFPGPRIGVRAIRASWESCKKAKARNNCSHSCRFAQPKSMKMGRPDGSTGSKRLSSYFQGRSLCSATG